jgi:hypothetical protein|eukprot:g6021.t1
MAALASGAGGTSSSGAGKASDFGSLLSKLEDSRKFIIGAKQDPNSASENNRNANAKPGEEYKMVKDHVSKAATLVEKTTTRFTVAVDCGLNSESILSLCRDTALPAESLTTACIVASYCGCTETLRNDIFDAVLPVIDSLSKLVQIAQEVTANKNVSLDDNKRFAVANGQVGAACKQLRRIPSSNKMCVKRRVLTAFKTIKDVCEEVNALIADYDEGCGSGGGDEAMMMGEDDEDDFFYDCTLSEEEYNRVKVCVRVFGMAVKSCQVFASILNNLACDNPESNPFLDEICKKCKKLQDAVNELGMVLFPPQKVDNIVGASRDVLELCRGYFGVVLELLNTSNGADRSVVDALLVELDTVGEMTFSSSALTG